MTAMRFSCNSFTCLCQHHCLGFTYVHVGITPPKVSDGIKVVNVT